MVSNRVICDRDIQFIARHTAGYLFLSFRNVDGPTVLMGGNHGDECEGQVALSELAKSLEPENINGQLIISPQANTLASQARKRTSPIDEGDLNRCFRVVLYTYLYDCSLH